MGIAIGVEIKVERPRVRISGTVQVIRHDRIGGMPALEAEIYDGPGRIDLVWLGRASIPGIEPGSTVVAEGRLGVRRGRATMFNPRYEIATSADGQPALSTAC
jgi:RecG-like helicase